MAGGTRKMTHNRRVKNLTGSAASSAASAFATRLNLLHRPQKLLIPKVATLSMEEKIEQRQVVGRSVDRSTGPMVIRGE